MWKPIKRYFRRLPGRFRRYRTSWYHNRIEIPRQKRQLSGYTSGITKVVDGAADSGSGLYCAFILFQPAGVIPNNVRGAIEAMRATRINVIACLNAPLAEESAEWLTRSAHKIIHRNNIGFDFGAYKDCVKFTTESFPRIKRFMLLNDSIFFLNNGLNNFFTEMMADFDAVAAFENWGDRTANHLQSFAVSVSDAVFYSDSFQGFWNNYIPVSSRLWAINEGEKKLSDAILRTAKTSDVLYTCARLYDKLASLDKEFTCSNLVVPAGYRSQLSVDESQNFPINKHYQDVVKIVNSSSPIHCGAWLFPHFAGAPIIKKDIVFRQRFQFWEVQLLFKDLMTADEFSEFSTQLRAKGGHEKLDRAALARYELGIG